MNLTSEFAYFSLCLEGFSFGKISVLLSPAPAKAAAQRYSRNLFCYIRLVFTISACI